ncbi:hypothetical protein [Wenjunlia tyrosinilytica]|jgi:hypothetical protein|uniref:Uncharacterized protein n=1 Tax=Wenjunlia tyrosinilytica TaxID=1544741 RepID=A0A917ZRS5_9ACTN|nr:hypothetical protein [Wenjunlia tyrosinilytica]GGO89400.1 hypothetical protein GCM10012280_32450 [Wenjunlia tyrosinilytica]
MVTGITVAVILAMIAVGVVVIQMLNAQHEQRIETFRYSDVLPKRRGRAERTQRPGAPDDAATETPEQEHRGESRRRLMRPRHDSVRSPRGHA